MSVMLLRLAHLSVTTTFALLCLLPRSDRDKDVEILVPRHQITILKHQLDKTRPRFSPAEWDAHRLRQTGQTMRHRPDDSDPLGALDATGVAFTRRAWVPASPTAVTAGATAAGKAAPRC
jgi:hypothetical protein